MKKNILIIVLLIAALTGAFTLEANAQDSTHILLADETTISYTKTMAKIECDNESIAKTIHQKFDQLIPRFTCTKKKDRHGEYKHYTFYLNKDDAQHIIKWAKTNL
jgi:hypothetical protein